MTLVVDIETVPTDAHRDAVRAEPYPTFSAPSNYKDPVKIAESIKAQAEAWLAGHEQRIAEGALDPRTGRIVCLGLGGIADLSLQVVPTITEADERFTLGTLWSEIARVSGRVVTFNGSFDLRFLVIRSLILGVKPTILPRTIRDWFRRYTTHPHFDCRAVLTNWDDRQKGTLGDWCKVLGIPHDDTVKGADVYGLYQAENFDAIAAHCRSDCAATAALYAKLAPFYDD